MWRLPYSRPKTAPKPKSPPKPKVNSPKPKVNSPKPMNLGAGIRVRNVTNVVKSAGRKAVTLGGQAYAMFLASGSAQALTIAATCLILIYIAAGLMGEDAQVRDLKRSIKNANSARRQRVKRTMALYSASMRAGNLNRAERVMKNMNTANSANSARIEGMRTELRALRAQIAASSPSVAARIGGMVNSLLPAAEKALELGKKAADLHVKVLTAQTNAEIAKITGQIALTEAQSRSTQQRIQMNVQRRLAPVRGAMGAVGQVVNVGRNVYTVASPAFPYVASAAGAVARFHARRRGTPMTANR